MIEIIVNSSGILDRMSLGAKLHRHLGTVELRMADGAVLTMPMAVFDSLIDEQKIVAEPGGFYRLSSHDTQ